VTAARQSLAGARAAVAGASGLLGSQVARLLADEGAEVRISRHRTPPPEDLAAEEVEGDLRDPAVARRLVEGADRLYVCTGVVGGAGVVGRSVAQVTQTLATAVQLMEAAAAAGVARVGVVSSATVYPPRDGPLREEDAFAGDPFDGYFGVAWANRSLEKVAEALVRMGASRIAVLRPSSIYGPRDRFGPHGNVLPGLVARAVAGEDPFVVWGDGTAVRDFVHAADVAEAMVAAVELAADGAPVNVGSGRSVTIGEAVDAVLAAAGHAPSRVVYDASKPTTLPVRVLDVGLARERLGFAPRFGLEAGLEDTIRWYRRSIDRA
jgi:GDP-L-fucose synthase